MHQRPRNSRNCRLQPTDELVLKQTVPGSNSIWRRRLPPHHGRILQTFGKTPWKTHFSDEFNKLNQLWFKCIDVKGDCVWRYLSVSRRTLFIHWAQAKRNSDEFLCHFVINDITWIHWYTTKTKKQSNQWTSPWELAPKKMVAGRNSS